MKCAYLVHLGVETRQPTDGIFTGDVIRSFMLTPAGQLKGAGTEHKDTHDHPSSQVIENANYTLMQAVKSLLVLLALLLGLATSPLSFAAVLTTPGFQNLGANQVTLVLQSSASETGYFTLLASANTACGSAGQVASGQSSSGNTAIAHGSLPLTAASNGYYTVRNLTQSTAYTVCFSDGSSVPVSANLTTNPATNLANTQWGNVGSPGFSAGEAYDISLTFAPDGTPYVAYMDGGNSNKATVMKFNGTVWVNVGNSGFSAGAAWNTSLAFAPNGSPYVAYQDCGNNCKATVMKFNGTNWVNVGNPGFSSEDVTYTSLAFAPDGTPYVAYGNCSYNCNETVMKFNGTAWVYVGNPEFSVGSATYTSLAFAPNGTPYVAYDDWGNSQKATVMKFNGTAWVYVGNPGFSAGQAFYTSLTFAQDGTPYVAYEDISNSSNGIAYGPATAMKFNGASWVNVGNPGFSVGSSEYNSLAFAPDGTPYVAYVEGSSFATVMKFNGTAWVNVPSFVFPAGAASDISLAFAPDGTPYVAYEDWDNSGNATVMKLVPNTTATNSDDCLFNWAETNYPSLFAPSGSVTTTEQVYTYRYYSATNAYLGVSPVDNHVYYEGSDGTLQDEGPTSYWLPLAGCQTSSTPTDCLFNWAEGNYSTLFAPKGATTATYGVYTYRHYSATNAYLGVSSTTNDVYYMGQDGISHNEGTLANWLPLAGCQ